MTRPTTTEGLAADEGIVLRTPLLPFQTLLEWATLDPARGRAFLVDLVQRPEIREAIFVASPSLHEALGRWLTEPDSAAGQRAEISLTKYLARMAGRATPFGLFSGVTPGKLGSKTEMTLAPRAEYRRFTRIDNDYLFALVDELGKQPEVRARLAYRPADSLYPTAGRLRYAQPRLVGRERTYHLISVERTPYLDATLARATTGAKLADLAAALVADDSEVTLDEAMTFVGELVDAHLLVPSIGITVTGPEPIDDLVAQLAAIGLDEPHRVLAAARERLVEIDRKGLGNEPTRYTEVAALLEPLPTKVEISRLFQVDMVKPGSVTLATKIAADVARGIEALRQISRPSERLSLDEFKTAFMDRYEGREVPLTEALDDESGIGFEASRAPGSEGSPLLAGLAFPGRATTNRVPFTRADAHLQRRLAAAIADRSFEIVLGDKDLEIMKSPRPPTLADGLSAMVRIAAGADDQSLFLLEGASGPSGARILGRFCHASPEIHDMVRRHIASEEALRPNALFAEIVHLNEGRIGNILCRPVLRQHEIVFLGRSGAPDEAQLPVDDLLVSVRENRVVLRSKRLDREIIPRLSTAHNFRLRSLGMYRFLCAFQTQDCTPGVGFDWGVLASSPFLPRVRIGRAVVERATWNLPEPLLEPITKAVRAAKPKGKAGATQAQRDAIASAVAALRDRVALPRFVIIADGDNELPLDLDNPPMVQAFADELAGRPEVKLKEVFPAPDALQVQGDGGTFTNEIVMTFVRQREPDRAPAVRRAPTVQRSFRPGSRCLYVKLYCGVSTADHVLRDVVAPVVRGAIASGDAEKWFFIRYNDPDPHLRVRLFGDPARLAANVLPALERAIEPLAAIGAVRKVLLDTYERELERYGGDAGIELCEDIFHVDSDAVLGIVELLDGDAGADARWRLAVRGSESLLAALGISPEARAKIWTDARESLGREHDADTRFYGQVGDSFKRERAALESVLVAHTDDHDLAPGLDLLDERDRRLAPIGELLRARDAAGELTPRLHELAWSLVHMHVNRLLHASQRAQELVIYDFLRRLHEGWRARAKQAASARSDARGKDGP